MPAIEGVQWEVMELALSEALSLDAICSRLHSSRADYFIFAASEKCFKSADKLRISKLLNSEPKFDLAYSDSYDQFGVLKHVVKRPAPSPERLRCQNYLGELIIVKASFFDEVSGFRSGFEGAEIYDLALRAIRNDANIVHIAEPLYTLTQSTSSSTDWSLLGEVSLPNIEAVLEEHLSQTGGGRVVNVAHDGVHDTRREVIGNPLVSIVIPTRARYDEAGRSYLLQTLQSIVEHSTYRNIEFVLVIDEGYDQALIEAIRILCEGAPLKEVLWEHPFNFSDKVNLGAVVSSGRYILLLNDDVKVISPNWIESLLALAQLDGAGLSGAMLYFEDDTIQHAGHAYKDGEASHIGLDEPRDSVGPLHGYRVEREIGGVTAACAMVPREVFYEVGGFTGLLPGAFNDVDFCFKISKLGYNTFWTPHAKLYHFESKSRDASVRQFEVEILRRRWGRKLLADSFWPYPFSRPVN